MGVLDKLAGAKVPQKPEKPQAVSSTTPKGVKRDSPYATPKGVKRDSSGRLLPGSATLNPGGRPKGREQEMREMLERAGGDAFLEQLIAGEVLLPDGEVQVVRDLRLRLEAYRMAADRAHGKALERSASVNVDLPAGEPVVDLDRLSDDVLDALLEAGVKTLAHTPAQLPQGETVDAEFVAEDLPGTDSMSEQSTKDKE